MARQERKTIKVSPGVAIEDLTKTGSDIKVYMMTADVFDKTGEKVEGGQVILKDIASSEQEVPEIVDRSKKHVGNIIEIQSRNGGRLENIKLFNLTIKEAEEQGFLRRPDVVQHKPVS